MSKEQLQQSSGQIENLFKICYNREIQISPDGVITDTSENLTSQGTYQPREFSSVEEEFGIIEVTTPSLPIKPFGISSISTSDLDEPILQEKLDDVKKDLKERVEKAGREYMSVMNRVNGEFRKTLNHAIRENAEEIPTVIENPNAPGWDPYTFTISGLNLDGDPVSYNVVLTGIYNPNSALYLNQPQPEPDIQVYPALLEIDFGDIEVGSTSTAIVQIYNFGNADLTVNDLTVTGNPVFQITNAPEVPFILEPSDTIQVDVPPAPPSRCQRYQ